MVEYKLSYFLDTHNKSLSKNKNKIEIKEINNFIEMTVGIEMQNEVVQEFVVVYRGAMYNELDIWCYCFALYTSKTFPRSRRHGAATA